jgi:hypothetical protein
MRIAVVGGFVVAMVGGVASAAYFIYLGVTPAPIVSMYSLHAECIRTTYTWTNSPTSDQNLRREADIACAKERRTAAQIARNVQ